MNKNAHAKSAKVAKATVKGLHLWFVPVFSGQGEDSLRITTKRRNIEDAMHKAKRFVQRNPVKYPKGCVEGCKYKGTLDA